MRMFMGMAALAALVAIGGCKSDATKLAEGKKEIGESCRKNVPPGINADTYCNCVVDKSIGNKSMAELEKMNEEQAKAMGMTAATECLAAQGMGLGGAPAGPAAAPATPAPAEATNQAGEAVEEGVDEAN
jgi:hypothetical protein